MAEKKRKDALQHGKGNPREQQLALPPWPRGPRNLFLRRCENGFGFTLRHFIVYPPETYSVLRGERQLGLCHYGRRMDEPMDTIFVKHVKESSSAHAAGLATGDRIVCVNGETIVGKTYAQVVQLIQQSGSYLHLLVVPKEDDILQLFFSKTAHNPETNQRPQRFRPLESMKSTLQFSHLPRPKPYQPVDINSSPGFAFTSSSHPSSSTFSSGVHAANATQINNTNISNQDPSHSWQLVRYHSREGTARRSSEGSVPKGLLVSGSGYVHGGFHLAGRHSEQQSGDVNRYGEGVVGGESNLWSPAMVDASRTLERDPSGRHINGASKYYTNMPSPYTFTVHSDSSVASTQSSKFSSVESVPSSVNSVQSVQPASYPQSNVGGRRESSISLPPSGQEMFSSKDSVQSFDSRHSPIAQSSDPCENYSADSMLSRIKKSCEQKEEFLKRPNQPIWLPVTRPQPIPREFYAHPQKFQKPLWPPLQNGPSQQLSPSRNQSPSTSRSRPTHQNLRRVKSIDSERDSSSNGDSADSVYNAPVMQPISVCETGQFIYGGAVTNAPTKGLQGSIASDGTVQGSFRSLPSGNVRHGKAFVTTLSRIHENLPANSAFVRQSSISSDDSQPSSLPCSLPSSPAQGSAGSNSLMRNFESDGEESSSPQPYPYLVSSLQLVSRVAKQFESGQLDDEGANKTNFYRSELSRLSAKKSIPNVAVRKKEFESRSKESKSLDSAGSTPPLPALSGNRLIPIGSKRLHCEPPSEFQESSQPSEPPKEPQYHTRSRSNSVESWISLATAASSWSQDEPQRRRAMRQDSYLAAVRTPVRDHGGNMSDKEPKKTQSQLSDCQTDAETPTKPTRPNQLTIPNPLRPAAGPTPLPVTSTPTHSNLDSPSPTDLPNVNRLKADIGRLVAAFSSVSPVPVSSIASTNASNTFTTTTATTSITSTTPSSNVVSSVVRRQKAVLDDEADRVVRRVSYLKATLGDRMHVDSDLELSDNEVTVHQDVHRKKWLGRVQLILPMDLLNAGRIHKIRQMFEEAALRHARMHANSAHMIGSADVIQQGPGSQKLRTAFSEGSHAPSSPASTPGDNKENQTLKEGWLHCKITQVDGKRAADRSWKQIWAVLRGPTLYILKDRKDSHQTPMSLEEQTVDVRSSLVKEADDYTKKKHVFRLNTYSGSELLLQADDGVEMLQWIRALREQNRTEKEVCHDDVFQDEGGTATDLKKHMSPGHDSHGSRLSPLPANKGIRKLTSFRTRSPTGQSPVNKTRKPSQSDQLPSPKSKTWKVRVVKQFRKMQGSSPSSPSAPHPEGATIGIPLEDCPMSSFSEYVPLIVELCTSIVEGRGLDIVGIYRIPGNTAAVTSLTECVNKGFDAINLQDTRWNDVNVISSLLKSFFRKLPDSVLTTELYPLFIEADKIDDPNKRISALKKLVHELPEHHFETLKFLMYHLKKIVEHSDVNKMEARNLAIVFGPTLVRAADMITMVTDMSHQCRIVESLIVHVDWFFSDDDAEDYTNLNLPYLLPQEASEGDSTALQHSLLLNNIQKVEGMKAETPNKEICAKDIVSSIISAANRKMQKARYRKGGGGGTIEDIKDCGVDTNDGEKQTSEKEKQIHLVVPSEVGQHQSSSSVSDQKLSVASSILSSVILSGNIVKTMHTSPEAPCRESVTSDNGAASNEASVLNVSNVGSQDAPSVQQSENLNKMRQRLPSPWLGDEVAIRTYTGLNATTQERIKKFELETKAMLHRDITKHKMDTEKRELEKQRIEQEWQQAKHELENDDILDQIADNPSAISKKMPEFTHRVSGLRPMDRTSGSETLSISSEHSSSSSSSLPPARPCPDRTKLSSSQSPSSLPPDLSPHHSTSPAKPGQVSSSSRFTQTKKLGSTHFYPESPRSGFPPSEVKEQAKKFEGRSKSSRAVGSPLLLRRGNSAENLTQVGRQNFDTQKIAPNGTLKRLKTGKEEADTVLQPQPISTIRCGSLDSLQEAYGLENKDRPHSDISDDGSDLVVSLTSTFEEKLKSLLNSEYKAEKKEVTGQLNDTEDKQLGNSSARASQEDTQQNLYRDPSLHRGESRSLERRELASKENGNSRRSEGALPSETSKAVLRSTADNREREGSRGRKREAYSCGSSDMDRQNDNTLSDNSTDNKLKEGKLKRSDSLTKTEKTESNNKTKDSKRRQDMMSRSNKVKEKENIEKGAVFTKLKRKNGMPNTSLKRRHTVGGTKDFDKINWVYTGNNKAKKDSKLPVWDRLQPVIVSEDMKEQWRLNFWLNKGRCQLRTSSPDLSSRDEGFLVAIDLRDILSSCSGRPQSLPDPNLASRIFKVPLESHV